MFRNRIVTIFSGALLGLGFTACSQKGDPSVAKRGALTQAKAGTPVDATTAATISGNVSFTGAVPKALKIDMSMDPGCRGENQVETFAVNDGQLANVVVYVKDGLKAPFVFVGFKQPVTIDQKGCRYIPHVAAVMAGDTVRFTNSESAE